MVSRVPLSFPNQSRSYDARQNCVRFWAYDQALEIPFFVNADALCGIDPTVHGISPDCSVRLISTAPGS